MDITSMLEGLSGHAARWPGDEQIVANYRNARRAVRFAPFVGAARAEKKLARLVRQSRNLAHYAMM